MEPKSYSSTSSPAHTWIFEQEEKVNNVTENVDEQKCMPILILKSTRSGLKMSNKS